MSNTSFKSDPPTSVADLRVVVSFGGIAVPVAVVSRRRAG